MRTGYSPKINKETGEQTVVGPTGITSKTMQAADFDPVTNRLYWTVEPKDGKSGLYEIDVNTGKASLIKTFPGNQWILALHVVPSPKAGAPARVKDIDVKPDYARAAQFRSPCPLPPLRERHWTKL